MILTGEFNSAMDEKGRLMIPSRLRGAGLGDTVVITRGIEQCAWVFTLSKWQDFCGQIIGATSIFKAQTRILQRRIIAPACECDLDRTGRVTLQPSLRKAAELKKEVVILGMINHLEIWDKEVYRAYEEETMPEFKEAAEKLGEFLSF